MGIHNKIVSDNHKFSWEEKKLVDGLVFALARLGLAEYAWVDPAYGLRREVNESVNYVMRATANHLFNDGGRTEYYEEEDV